MVQSSPLSLVLDDCLRSTSLENEARSTQKMHEHWSPRSAAVKEIKIGETWRGSKRRTDEGGIVASSDCKGRARKMVDRILRFC